MGNADFTWDACYIGMSMFYNVTICDTSCTHYWVCSNCKGYSLSKFLIIWWAAFRKSRPDMGGPKNDWKIKRMLIVHWYNKTLNIPSGPSDAALISSTSYFMLIVQRSAKRLVRGCKKISSCSCLTVPPGPAWVLLSKIYKPFSLSLYVPHNTSFVSGPVFGLTYRWILGQTLVTSSFHPLASGSATDVQGWAKECFLGLEILCLV